MAFKEIGQKIQQAREEKGYSQEQLAHLIGCSQSTLSNYEKGKRRIYWSQLEQMAQVLEKPIDYFMEAKPSNKVDTFTGNGNKELLTLVNEFYSLNPEERRNVLEYIRFIHWRKGEKTP